MKNAVFGVIEAIKKYSLLSRAKSAEVDNGRVGCGNEGNGERRKIDVTLPSKETAMQSHQGASFLPRQIAQIQNDFQPKSSF